MNEARLQQRQGHAATMTRKQRFDLLQSLPFDETASREVEA